MYKGQRICVVIPAHNEEPFIGEVIRTLPSFVDHVVVVDDGSQDRTHQVAREQEDSRVIVLQTPYNAGMGGATLLGYRKALELESDVVVKMDGDGQMLPRYIPDLLDAIIEQHYDYTKGNRFFPGESLTVMPRHRLVGNMMLTFFNKLSSGYWHIFDPENGYTAIKARVLNSLPLDKLNPGFFFTKDLLFQLSVNGFRTKDVPIPARYGSEQSDIRLSRELVVFSVLLLKRFFQRVYQKYVLRDFSPIALFLYLGLALFLWGGGFGLYLWIRSSITGAATATGTIMLAVLPLILGFQLLLQAIVLDIQETPK